MHPMLNIAIRAARVAGDLIVKNYETPEAIEANQKGNNTFIANIERKAEHLILEIIHKLYPQHSILSEENGVLNDEDNNIQWIIDSLNGATNLIKCFPHFSVSIAVRINGRTEVAVVYDPIRNELFTASRGQGAQLNGYRLRGGTARDLNGTILAIGFPFKQKQHFNNYFTLVKTLFIQCADFRCTGSAALDFAYIAAGRIDGFFETCLKPWDFIGGELLVREAGGLVTNLTGEYDPVLSGNIVAGNFRIVKAILAILHKN